MVVGVLTWNVLHRIHAVNWDEAPVRTFPDESTRVRGVVDQVASMSAGLDVICLQEVSGDQLAALRARFAHAAVFDHLYPRVPRLRRPDVATLADPSEHLVTIALRPGARARGSQTARTDSGKGFLAIELDDGTIVVNAHVSARERSPGQLAALGAFLRTAAGLAIVAGDFNATRDVVLAAFASDGVAVSDVSGQPATRTSTPDKPGHTIDHVTALRGAIREATVGDALGLSDHLPVSAVVASAGSGASA